jgi:hypothetical protein
LAIEDIAKIAFRCPDHVGLYEWIVVTFWLKNVGATYQRAMNYIFHELINKIVEIYIDDVVVKSKSYKEHLADLRKTLGCKRKHGLKMNPNKCAFSVSASQFLGFLIVTPDFTRKTECISYVRQDQNYTHMIEKRV